MFCNRRKVIYCRLHRAARADDWSTVTLFLFLILLWKGFASSLQVRENAEFGSGQCVKFLLLKQEKEKEKIK